MSTAAAKPHRLPVYRVALVRERSIRIESARIGSTSEAAAVITKHIGHADREHVVVLLLNGQNEMIGIHTCSVGTLDAGLVNPPEVFKAAILGNAAAIIVGHNHPSGHVAPSSDDRVVTKQLQQAGSTLGIPVLEHIIVGGVNSPAHSWFGIIASTAGFLRVPGRRAARPKTRGVHGASR